MHAIWMMDDKTRRVDTGTHYRLQHKIDGKWVTLAVAPKTVKLPQGVQIVGKA